VPFLSTAVKPTRAWTTTSLIFVRAIDLVFVTGEFGGAIVPASNGVVADIMLPLVCLMHI
jgi:hypothetical protein